MIARTLTGIVFLALATALTGCSNGSGPSAPTSTPSQQLTGSGRDTYLVTNVTLSGVVYEVTPAGRVPIEGVRVLSDYFHVLPSPNVVTDSQGFFSVRPVWVCPCSWAPWVDAGITSIWIDKDGYKVVAGQTASAFHHPLYPDAPRDSGLRDVTIDGDTRIDVQLVRE